MARRRRGSVVHRGAARPRPELCNSVALGVPEDLASHQSLGDLVACMTEVRRPGEVVRFGDASQKTVVGQADGVNTDHPGGVMGVI